MTLLSVLKDEGKSSIEIWSKNTELTFSSASSNQTGWDLATHVFLIPACVGGEQTALEYFNLS